MRNKGKRTEDAKTKDGSTETNSEKPTKSLHEERQKKNSHENRIHRKKVRGFWIATVCFALFCVVLGVSHLWMPSHRSSVEMPSDSDIRLLEETLQETKINVAVPTFNKLVLITSQVSSVIQNLVEKMVRREATTNEDLPALLSHFDIERDRFNRVERTLWDAGDLGYDVVSSILKQKKDARLLGVAKHLPATLFAWISALVHLHNAVLTEIALMTNDPKGHTRALLRSLSLLSWASDEALVFRHNTTADNHFTLFNWTTPSHLCSVKTREWKAFCEKSMASAQIARVRSTANLEELIALHSKYAPFRLHYVAMLAQLDDPQRTYRTTLTSTISSQEKKLSSYAHRDELHRHVLHFLSLYAQPDTATAEGVEKVLAAFGSCNRLRRPFLEDEWPKFGVRRPALFSNAFLTQVRTVWDERGLLPSDSFFFSCVSS